MGVTRDRTIGNRERQDSDEETERLRKLSLKGKWIALARAWLEPRMPCKKTEYIISVSILMPTHIRRQGRSVRSSDTSLAKQALKFLKAVIEDDMITSISGCKPGNSSKAKYDHKTTINELVDSDGVIDLGSERFKSKPKKEKDACTNWIRRRAVKVGPRKYKLKDYNSTSCL